MEIFGDYDYAKSLTVYTVMYWRCDQNSGKSVLNLPVFEDVIIKPRGASTCANLTGLLGAWK